MNTEVLEELFDSDMEVSNIVFLLGWISGEIVFYLMFVMKQQKYWNNLKDRNYKDVINSHIFKEGHLLT